MSSNDVIMPPHMLRRTADVNSQGSHSDRYLRLGNGSLNLSGYLFLIDRDNGL